MRVGKVARAFCRGLPNHFAEKWPERGYTWAQCKTEEYNSSTVPFYSTEGGRVPYNTFRPECAPDVLYSWHGSIAGYVKSHSPGNLLDLGGTHLFLWRTPVGSYGYGPDSIRVKLKPTARFKLIAENSIDCDLLKRWHNDIENTVFIDYQVSIPGYSEYILCSDGPVESWSHDTYPHELEMLRETDWFQKEPKGNMDVLRGEGPPWTANDGLDVKQCHANWTKEMLDYELLRIHDRVAKEKGEVYFARDAVPSLWKHYSTLHPGYFNPLDANQYVDTWPERDPDGCKMSQR